MSFIDLRFRAFIPKSLGKPMLSYFERHPSFNAEILNNYHQFKSQLRQLDRHGYQWIPEPGNSVSGYYCSTDNRDFNSVSTPSSRLSVHAKIDIGKIGNLSRKDKIFVHSKHSDGSKGDHGHQHSGNSHRAQAYIKHIPFHIEAPKSSQHDIYYGVCNNTIKPMRSEEAAIKPNIHNYISRSAPIVPYRHNMPFIDDPMKLIANDATKIHVTGSAGYPFTEPASPNIDFDMVIDIQLSHNHHAAYVDVKGWHNRFPAYELILGNNILYSYNPVRYGYTGPGFINLTQSVNFRGKETIRLSAADQKLLGRKYNVGI